MKFSNASVYLIIFSAALLTTCVGVTVPQAQETTPVIETQGKAEIETVVPATASVQAEPDAAISEMSAAPTPPIDVLPAKTAETKGLYFDVNEITHPQIDLTPDKSELVRLEGDAASIIIGNPAHLSIMAESSKLLVLVPRSPGASYFTVLNTKGEVVMQRHVIVASPKEKYIRVRRSCAGSSNQNCQETSVYYCPDMCHQILMADPENGSGGASSGNGSADMGAAPPANAGTSPPGESPSEETSEAGAP